MTYDSFITKYKGKRIDYDGTAGVQCVDLAKQYLHDVWGINPGSWGNAYAYYANFYSHQELVNNFTRIANTSSTVPGKGWIAVFGTKLNKYYGHICICDGVGNTSYFYSYDQNWTGKNEGVTRVKHNYNYILGFLKPKDSTKISGSTTSSGSSSTSTGKTYPSTPFKVTVLVSNLNIRKGAGTNYAVTGKYTGKGDFIITQVSGNWGKLKSDAGWIYLANSTYCKIGSTVTSTNSFSSYKVKITATTLKIRKGAGTNYGVNGTVKKGGIYTITAESSGSGSTKGWGRLKSGAGWISLDYCTKV